MSETRSFYVVRRLKTTTTTTTTAPFNVDAPEDSAGSALDQSFQVDMACEMPLGLETLIDLKVVISSNHVHPVIVSVCWEVSNTENIEYQTFRNIGRRQGVDTYQRYPGHQLQSLLETGMLRRSHLVHDDEALALGLGRFQAAAYGIYSRLSQTTRRLDTKDAVEFRLVATCRNHWTRP